MGVQMVRDLRAVIEREKAPIGIFVCLTEPTGPMKTEAAKAGYYEDENGNKYPRIQILTIEELLDGAKPDIPLVDVGAMFKQAAKEKSSGQQGYLGI